jgi:hypothetical protein
VLTAAEATVKAALPKVTPQGVHQWLQHMGWDSETRRSKYPTKYKFNPNTREQFKLTVREYARMEEEKDSRQFGSLLDSLARLSAGNRVEPRWAEVMKIVSAFLEMGEYGAMGTSAALWDAVESPEQRNGYLAQVEDEVRHVTQCGYLSHYFATQYYDPAGFTDFRKHRYAHPFFGPDRASVVEHALSGDPVQMSLNLQLVAEAAFTNPLIVALTETAAANGDEITPTIFLSIESDELRHMANGYQTIVSIVDDPDNMRYLQTDLENAFWINHKFITPFTGVAFDYFTVNKGEPWAKRWDKWVHEDWGGIWLGRLGRFGVESPKNQPRRTRTGPTTTRSRPPGRCGPSPAFASSCPMTATSSGSRTATPAITTRSGTSSTPGGRTASTTPPTTRSGSTCSSTGRFPSTSAGCARCRRSCRPSTTASPTCASSSMGDGSTPSARCGASACI